MCTAQGVQSMHRYTHHLLIKSPSHTSYLVPCPPKPLNPTSISCASPSPPPSHHNGHAQHTAALLVAAPCRVLPVAVIGVSTFCFRVRQHNQLAPRQQLQDSAVPYTRQAACGERQLARSNSTTVRADSSAGADARSGCASQQSKGPSPTNSTRTHVRHTVPITPLGHPGVCAERACMPQEVMC